MKRRDFLSVGAGVLAATSLPHGVSAQSATPAAETHLVGDFILTRTATGLQVAHKNAPNHVIWDTVADGNFLVAGLPPEK